MNRHQAEQISRIIYNVFEHEKQIDPRTVATMFHYMGIIDWNEELNTNSKSKNPFTKKDLEIIMWYFDGLKLPNIETEEVYSKVLSMIDNDE